MLRSAVDQRGSIPRRSTNSCGACHRCRHALMAGTSQTDGRPAEWCPECAETFRYRSHGFGGQGTDRSSCVEGPRECLSCAHLGMMVAPRPLDPEPAELEPEPDGLLSLFDEVEVRALMLSQYKDNMAKRERQRAVATRKRPDVADAAEEAAMLDHADALEAAINAGEYEDTMGGGP